MWFIQILCVVLVLLWECEEDALQARVFILTHDDELVDIIFTLEFAPIRSKLF